MGLSPWNRELHLSFVYAHVAAASSRRISLTLSRNIRQSCSRNATHDLPTTYQNPFAPCPRFVRTLSARCSHVVHGLFAPRMLSVPGPPRHRSARAMFALCNCCARAAFVLDPTPLACSLNTFPVNKARLILRFSGPAGLVDISNFSCFAPPSALSQMC